MPQIGERIRVRAYRYGGGLAGNVAAGATTSVTGVRRGDVGNPLPATGGADAASLDEALDAIPAEVHRRDRAVVADDFRDLAAAGHRGGPRRDRCPCSTPTPRACDAAGVVSVLVFPDRGPPHPGRARCPTSSLLRRVARYLDPRRLVTTELYVIPPTYRPMVGVGRASRSATATRWTPSAAGSS